MKVKPNPKKMIVAEVAKNWPIKVASAADDGINSPLLSQRFENVIAVNAKRGYRLHSWRMNSVWITNGTMQGIVETIIAVFEEI